MLQLLQLEELRQKLNTLSPQERRTFTVLEFLERNGIGRSKLYAEVRAGRLEIIKAGRRTLITKEAEDRWIRKSRRPSGSNPPQGSM